MNWSQQILPFPYYFLSHWNGGTFIYLLIQNAQCHTALWKQMLSNRIKQQYLNNFETEWMYKYFTSFLRNKQVSQLTKCRSFLSLISCPACDRKWIILIKKLIEKLTFILHWTSLKKGKPGWTVMVSYPLLQSSGVTTWVSPSLTPKGYRSDANNEKSEAVAISKKNVNYV